MAVFTIVLGATFGSMSAPDAFAANVSVVSDQPGPPRMLYKALPGETNTVTVDLTGCAPLAGVCSAGTYTITDSTAPLTPGNGCGGGPGTVNCAAAGTNRAAVLAGDMNDTVTMNARTPKGTFIAGEEGDDTLTGGPGTDFIRGGPGADHIDGGLGNDDIDPGTVTPVDPAAYDPDTCTFHLPGPCPDSVEGGAGFNTIRFSSAPGPVTVDERSENSEQAMDANGFLLVKEMRRISLVVGTKYNDQLYGGPRNDRLVGGGGADVICGGYGNDTVDYSGSTGPVNVSLDATLPPDPHWASNSPSQWSLARRDCRQSDSLGTPIVDAQHPQDCSPNDGGAADLDPTTGRRDCVGSDVENVIGSPYDDVLVGNDPGPYTQKAAFFEPRGRNVLDGGGGNDLLDGGLGADVLTGGPGTDTVSYASETKPVNVTLDGAANDGSVDDLNPDSGQGDSVGDDVENIIGGKGDDVLAGSSPNPAANPPQTGDNHIEGGPGNDLIQGDGGNDILDGQDGNDILQGGAGTDQLHGGPGDDTLVGGIGPDLLDGGDGSDTVDYSSATTPVFAAPDGLANDGVAGEGDNVTDSVESLIGGSANDVLVGNAGNGTLSGGPGDDTLDGGGGADHIIGGDGLDVVSYAGRSNPVSVDLQAGTGGEPGEGDLIDSDVEGVIGGSGNDVIAGTDAVNLLFGGPGNDTLSGRGGDDQMFGGDGNDTLNGDGGSDKLSGDAGDDILHGGADPDALNGGEGNDLLDGGAGSDVLIGGPGNDTADYSARTKNVDVTLDGADNDGETNENDQIRATVESTKTGGGNDTINVRDGIAGDVSCGGGTDVVIADMADRINDNCEQKNVFSTATCSVRSGSVALTSDGVVGIRITCPVAGKGTVTLQTAGAYKAAKKTRKKVTLGRTSFSLKAGRSTTVKVKLSKKARRLVKKNRRLHVRATVAVKARSASNTTRRSKTLTLRAAKGKK